MIARHIASRRLPRSCSGFTLVELLAALLVLTLLTSVVAVGTSGALDVYRREQFASQAQMLSGTVDSSLADPFRFMTSTLAEDGQEVDTVVFHRQTISAAGGVRLVSIDGQLYLQGDQGDFPLLNGSAYGNCKIELVDDPTDPEDDYSCTSVCVKGAYRITDASDPSLSRTYRFYYTPLGESYTRELPIPTS